MNALLQPFDEVDQESIRLGLEMLHTVGFFQKYAAVKASQLIARFDSIQKEDRAMELERLSAVRLELLYLANESATLAGETQDSRIKETQNELSVDE